MRRLLVGVAVLALVAASCSSGPDAEDYYESLANLNATYVIGSRGTFDSYRLTIVTTEDPAFEEKFIAGSRLLYGGLAAAITSVSTGLENLEPPADAEEAHGRLVSAVARYRNALVAADAQLKEMTDSVAVNSIVSTVPIGPLQQDYKEACSGMQRTADEGGFEIDLGCDAVGT